MLWASLIVHVARQQPQVQAGDIAGIHATILSIFFGVLGLYLVDRYRRDEEKREEVLRRARAVNDIPAAGLPFPIVADAPPYFADGEEELRELVSKLEEVAFQSADVDEDIDETEAGKKVLRIMSSVLNQYPFPPAMNEPVKAREWPSSPDPIRFASLGEVQEWLASADAIDDELTWARGFLHQELSELLEASDFKIRAWRNQPIARALDLSKQEQRRLNESRQEITSGGRPSFGRDYVSAFFRQLNRLREVARRTRLALDDLRIYRSRSPNRTVLLTVVAAGVVVLVSGVLIPLLRPVTSQWITVGIPVAIYTFGLIGAFWLILHFSGRLE